VHPIPVINRWCWYLNEPKLGWIDSKGQSLRYNGQLRIIEIVIVAVNVKRLIDAAIFQGIDDIAVTCIAVTGSDRQR
jgi:hypothetical protein